MIMNTADENSRRTQTLSFERFTDRSRKIMALAKREAEVSGCTEIMPEHLILGMIKEGSGIASFVLDHLGINLQSLKTTVESHLPKGREATSSMAMLKSTETIQCLNNAVKAAKDLNHNYIGTEHLLLGVLNTPCKANDILESLEIRAEEIKRYVLELVGPSLIPTEATDNFTTFKQDHTDSIDGMHPILAKLLIRFCAKYDQESIQLVYKDSNQSILQKMDEDFREMLEAHVTGIREEINRWMDS